MPFCTARIFLPRRLSGKRSYGQKTGKTAQVASFKLKVRRKPVKSGAQFLPRKLLRQVIPAQCKKTLIHNGFAVPYHPQTHAAVNIVIKPKLPLRCRLRCAPCQRFTVRIGICGGRERTASRLRAERGAVYIVECTQNKAFGITQLHCRPARAPAKQHCSRQSRQ